LGVQVWIEAPDGTTIGVLSNRQRRFLLLNVPLGQHTLQFGRLGYEAHEQVVDATGQRSAGIQVALKRVDPSTERSEPAEAPQTTLVSGRYSDQPVSGPPYPMILYGYQDATACPS
jgi:hypothetical protein